MAVQKSKKTRSRRGMRRSHDALTSNVNSIVEDEGSGELRRRHHVGADGVAAFATAKVQQPVAGGQSQSFKVDGLQGHAQFRSWVAG